MDQLERELKQVQLRREQLALERELKRKRMMEGFADGVASTTSMSIGSALRLFRGIFRFARRWWVLAVCVAVMAGAAFGAMEWRRMAAEERRAAAEQQRYAAEAAFVLKQCGRECVGNGTPRDYFACASQNLEQYFPCRSAASKRFESEWPK